MHETGKGSLSHRYRIFETKQFQTDLARLGSAAQKRLQAKLRQFTYPILRDNPHFGPNIKRLKNWEPATWCYRIGDWRFFYEIDENEGIVFMIAAEHRKEAYR